MCCKSNNPGVVRRWYVFHWEYLSGLTVNLGVLVAYIFTFSPQRRWSYLTETSAHTAAAVLNHRSESDVFSILQAQCGVLVVLL